MTPPSLKSSKSGEDRATFSIGNLVLALFGDRRDVDYYRNGHWHSFLVDDDQSPDVNIRSCYGPPPKLNSFQLEYDSGHAWRLFRGSSGHDWRTEFSTGGEIYKVAVFGAGESRLDIYLPEPDSRPAGVFPLDFPLDELLFAEYLSHHGGLEVHCCAMSCGGQGVIFAGVSGSGKSTMSALWKDIPGVVVLSDDRAIVRRVNGQLLVHGTPWHGDAGIAAQGAAPLRQIYFLSHGPENVISELAVAGAVGRLTLNSVGAFWNEAGVSQIMDFASEIVREVPCVAELAFRPDREVVDLLQRRLSGGSL